MNLISSHGRATPLVWKTIAKGCASGEEPPTGDCRTLMSITPAVEGGEGEGTEVRS
jgi:hypothetical protein